MTAFVTRATEKLRARHSVAGAIHMFVMTNRFRERGSQYCNGLTVRPIAQSVRGYDGTRRRSAGRTTGDQSQRLHIQKSRHRPARNSPAGVVQGSLFDQVDVQSRHSDALMAALDRLNKRVGRDTVTVASASTQKRWTSHVENKARATRIDGVNWRRFS